MLINWIHNLCSRFPGISAGESVGVLSGSGNKRGATASRAAAEVRPAITCIRRYLWPALLLVLLAPVQGITANTGDPIINRASLQTSGSPPSLASVAVTLRVRTQATIEFLVYSPGAPTITVPTTWYQTGSNPADPFLPVPPPVQPGSGAPIDLAAVPLLPANWAHVGQPVFIRVTDRDQNIDSTVTETILTTIIVNPSTGDTETLRLTETGPNTGIFVGYIQTSAAAAVQYNSQISVAASGSLEAHYTDKYDGTDIATAAVLIDPAGVVFDSIARIPVNGATVAIFQCLSATDCSNNTPATVYGDDGTSSFPATVISGGTASDSSGVTYQFPQGGFRFPFLAPGYYQIRVTPLAGHTAPSTNHDIGSPYIIWPVGSYGGIFQIVSGPAIQIDIPVDPSTGPLWLTKSAGKSLVSAGEFLSYELNLENNDTVRTFTAAVVNDTLPAGFSYQHGSTRVNGVAAPDPLISPDGSSLTFTLGNILPSTSTIIRYVVAIGAGANVGTATNTAVVTASTSASTSVKSNTAKYDVQVQEPFMMSRNIIMGRVIVGACSDNIDDNKKGMEGIGIYLEDGTFVFSDKFGMFHFEGVRSGAHVVQLDLDSIPEGYKILPCEQNSRFAGRAYSQFVDMQGGTMWRTDFHIGKTALTTPAAADTANVKLSQAGSGSEGAHATSKEVTTAETAQLPTASGTKAGTAAVTTDKGEVSFEMVSGQNDDIIDYRLPLQAHTVSLKNLRLQVSLPAGAKYIYGSSSFNGTTLPDPEVTSAGLVYPLEDTTDKWRGELQFRAVIDKKGQAGELLTRAVLRFDTAVAVNATTPEVTNVLSLTKDETLVPLPPFVFRPHFPTFGSELTTVDLEELDLLVNRLADKVIKRIDVTGHTDNVRIAPRSRDIYTDNSALSLARARSVGRFLTSALHLPPDALYLNGSADKEPVATNKTETGRALNRRVEVRITALQRIETADLKLIKERSGVEKLETVGAPVVQKNEAPLPLAPLQLKETVVIPQSSSNPTETAMPPAQGNQQPQQQGTDQNKQLNKTSKLPVAPENNAERVELLAAVNEGVVHFRVRLRNIKNPQKSIKATITLPPNLLYITGTSSFSGKAVNDPETTATNLTYTFTDIANGKNLSLQFQALLDGENPIEQLKSSVAVVLSDPADKSISSLNADTDYSAALDEVNRVDEPLPDKDKPVAQETVIKDDSELYQERIEKSVVSPTVAQPAKDNGNHVTEDDGILSPPDKSVVASQINAVRIVLNSALTPVLSIDGKEVPAERIGFSMKDHKSDKSLYTYIGVDFGDVGEHTLQLKGVDTFGVVRFDKSTTIARAGEITYIRLVSADGNIADGKTPVKMQVRLFDKDEKPVHASVELTIKGGELRPLTDSVFGTAAAMATVSVSGDGWINFQPVTSSGMYRTQLSYNKAMLDVETYVKPKMRDWILVGIAEGTAGYNTLSGHMENAKSSGAEDHLYDRERLALYAKGTIKGEWLLTMAYDSAKQRTGVAGNALFQTIDPNNYYTLYGDATAQGYEAASQSKLYLKIERDQFYALFGDYDTGLTVTELSRYSRRMNGIKSEFRSKNFEATVFGAETGQSFVKDELRGDGTSGLYRLSRKGIVINSDKITIETHDRFHSEIVTDSRQLSRFIDYTIDYDTGAIFFKSPVPSKDERLNPVFIVVDYEITNTGGDALTYGGRAGTTLLNGRLKAGATYVHEGQVSGESNLYGVDAGLQLGPGTRARAEFATTTTDVGTTKTNGNAWLAEITHTDKNFDGRAYYREQESGFGLGQQQGSETGTRKFGVDGAYKLNQQLAVGGQAYRQYNLADGAVRDFIESLATYTDKQYSGRVGLRYANDSLADGSNNTSIQAAAGGSWKTLNERLTLRADHEQSLFNNNDNTDFPTRSIFGLDYQLTKETQLFAQEELTYGTAANTNTTRVGMKTTPWSGGTMATSMVNDIKENSERTFANVGLAQKWQVTPQWVVDGGLDHNQTIRKKTGYSLYNPRYVPPASGGEDFTAVSLGANYTAKKLVWSNRVEFRNSDTDDKWGILSGLINEQGLNWGWTARLQLFHTQSPGGSSRTAGDLRFGLAYRPPVTKWIILDRLDLIATEDKTATSSTQGRRIVNNLNANYRPDKQTQVSLQYGAKYVLEKIDENDYSGYTDLIGIEGRYDLTKEWDLGLRSSMLHTWDSHQFGYSFGPSVGYNVMENAWISLGYNVVGFHDKDFSAANYTAQGPFVQFRFKFDQNSIKDGLKALHQ